jgi:four helix bundle protein
MSRGFKDLTVYKKAFSLAMDIFEISKSFPKEEKYSLTDQIRRSSRSVCTGIAEAYRKRDYPGYFVSKSSDADMENSETQVWLHFCVACRYIDPLKHDELFERSEEVGKLLNHMVENPKKYVKQKQKLEGVQ